MLTPGMNGYGLGPGVDEFTFSHGGADEGFRAQLMAWKGQPHAVVIMVNSDNGVILQEIMYAVVKEYDLPGIKPDIREVIQLPTEALQKYSGKFGMVDIGTLEVKVVEGQLVLEVPSMNSTVNLSAQSETSFFDREDGTRVAFEIEGDKVIGFIVQGRRADRID
jgi:hypothetical protein